MKISQNKNLNKFAVIFSQNKKKKKLGYLLKIFPLLSETFVIEEINELKRRGFQPVVASLYRPPHFLLAKSCSNFFENVLYWFDIDKSILTFILKKNFNFFLKQPFKYLATFLKWKKTFSFSELLKLVYLADFFSSKNVYHIHTHFAWEHLSFLQFIKDLTGITYSVTVHAADIFTQDRLILKRLLNEASFVTTISNYNKNFLIYNHIFNPSKIFLVRCGLNSSWFKEKIRPFWLNKPPLILSVGRLVPKKGFDTLIQALFYLKNENIPFRAEIIGSGPLENELRSMVSKYNLDFEVKLLGPLEHSKVKEKMQNADIFVLACKQALNGDMDGIPVVLMEAMALGKIVISTKLSGIPELIQHSINGFLVDPDNPFELAQVLKMILTNSYPAQIVYFARETISKEYTIEKQVDNLLKAFRLCSIGI